MAFPRSSIAIILAICYSLISAAPFHLNHGLHTSAPIVRRSSNASNKSQKSGAIGLGDFYDLRYSMEVAVGSTAVHVALDTGSSDLWSISTGCSNTSCGSIGDTPQISPSSLNASGLSITLNYGDSNGPSNASGTILSGPVGVSGFQIEDQLVAAVNETNTKLPDSGFSGIFGVGFPLPRSSSVIFNQTLGHTLGSSINISGPEITDAYISAFPTQGPLLSRLITSGQLEQPMYTVTLERDAIDIGENVGQLTIGQLPDGVSNESLTWVPVWLYTEDQGGLPGPTSNPNEVYPLRWEIPLDDVLLNGTKLTKPALNSSIGYSALVDSGTPGLSGPKDVVASIIYSSISTGLSNPDDGDATVISCDTPVDLTFVIGGNNFPVDPRDFLGVQNNTKECNAGMLSPTDPPQVSGLMSWILGDPFMKSNLVAFYFGNLTHPSVDPPRIGFLSTVPSNAGDLFTQAVNSAKSDGDFEATTVAAPTGTTFSALATNSMGVAQAATVQVL